MDKKTHTDLRVLRTRKLLRDAFVDLLQEMDVEKISVNRLTERATINRVTFYLHYKDIPDMIEKLTEEMIADITEVLEKSATRQNPVESGDWPVGFVNLLEYIAENAKFYKTVLGSNGIGIFRERLTFLIRDRIVSGVEEKRGETAPLKVKKDILLWYDSSAFIGTIVSWLQNDMPYTPEFLAKQFYLIHTRDF
ncbi:TetR family transcriptional regulator C-terminal domain-containing protein [Caldibacillus lycopersici]|uniref:TetR family transcriptional regulator C-terminal domain-containing protein n=1 Tax=Perspicuibacillus lycopersici TaxID=1325689 RepID=A0AAE3ITF8_9BACI|nr:TetR-like C-terminal domain-containing protein [Perspicuibacillus lycopersici]MCU9613146.1 TetR family transcriptional regulator C-terminal domain-containing protein [Perspicuibacillus lycopersici]